MEIEARKREWRCLLVSQRKYDILIEKGKVSFAAIQSLAGLLISCGMTIYNVYRLVNDGIEMIKSRPARHLANRASSIAEILQQVEHSALFTVLGQRIVQALVNSAAWSLEYESIGPIKKVLNQKKYAEAFSRHHRLITQALADFAHTLTIKAYGTSVPLLSTTKTFSNASKTDLSLLSELSELDADSSNDSYGTSFVDLSGDDIIQTNIHEIGIT